MAEVAPAKITRFAMGAGLFRAYRTAECMQATAGRIMHDLDHFTASLADRMRALGDICDAGQIADPDLATCVLPWNYINKGERG